MSEHSLIVCIMSTREKIVLSAVELFIEKGIARTTTKEIAASAGVAEGSIYRYFQSKDEMAWQIFDSYHQQLAQQLQASIKEELSLDEKVNRLVSTFLSLADNDWLMFRYYLTSQHTHIDRVKENSLSPYDVVLNLIKKLAAERIIVNKDETILAAMVMGSVHQIGLNKIYSRITGDLIEHKALVINTVLKMLTKEQSFNE